MTIENAKVDLTHLEQAISGGNIEEVASACRVAFCEVYDVALNYGVDQVPNQQAITTLFDRAVILPFDSSDTLQSDCAKSIAFRHDLVHTLFGQGGCREVHVKLKKYLMS